MDKQRKFSSKTVTAFNQLQGLNKMCQIVNVDPIKVITLDDNLSGRLREELFHHRNEHVNEIQMLKKRLRSKTIEVRNLTRKLRKLKKTHE